LFKSASTYKSYPADGDDHVWVGNPEVLRGGGGWRDFDMVGLGKRSRSERMDTRSSSPANSEPVRRAIQYGDEDIMLEEEVCNLISFNFAQIINYLLSH
jgi:hypothetical protein